MDTKTLTQLGLNEDQSKVYLFLVSRGLVSARKIATETSINRSLVYKVLKELMALELVHEVEPPAKIKRFAANDPAALQKLVDEKLNQAKMAKNLSEEAVASLSAQFNITAGKPSIRFFEGIAGLKTLYRDILLEKKDIKLIRSPLDNDDPERDKLIDEAIRNQVANNIHAQVISSRTPTAELMQKDEKNSVTRCYAPREGWDIAAQVMIYGKKVALTSFEPYLITTIIEDESVARTFESIFQALWEKYYK